MMGNFSTIDIKLLVLSLAMANVQGGTICPTYWTKVGNSCYRVSPQPMNWFKAQQVAIQTLLSNGMGYWIGLIDLADEGVFVWQSDFQAATYTNWNGGEPNNAGVEDCTHMWSERNFKWNDAPCGLTDCHALCERVIP